MDFWSIWVGPKDLPELKAELLRELGHDVDGPKPGKYPLGNRLYHLAIVLAGLAVVASGLLHDGARPHAALHPQSVPARATRRGASPTSRTGWPAWRWSGS